MSELKCPFCQQKLDTGRYYVHCHNLHCNKTVDMEGTEEMWEALIRTRKALEIAVDALKDFSIHPDDSVKKYAKKVLEQITAEQKD